MTTLPGRRELVAFLQSQGISQRRACGLAVIHRGSVLYKPRPKQDAPLLSRMQAIARKHPRWGVRKVYQTLRHDGNHVNHKRVLRLWRGANLQVKARSRSRYKPPPPVSRVSVTALRPRHVWSLDFIFDLTERKSKLKMLTVGDDFTRQCLAIAVRTAFSSAQVQTELERLFVRDGVPTAV